MKLIPASLLLYLLSHSVALAETNFEDTFGIAASGNYSAIADQVVSTRYDDSDLTLHQKSLRLNNLQIRIEAKIQQFPEDPMLWFLSGLNQNNLAEVQYLLVLQKFGQTKAAADIDVSNYNIARSRAYDNAIRLDSNEPHLLSAGIYATMGYGLSNKQKVKTYSRELDLGGASENESNEWFMHWAKIDALVHEKKLDEAQSALSELKELLEKRGKKPSPYSSIVDRADTQVATVVKNAEMRKSKSTGKQKAAPIEIENSDKPWVWKNWVLLFISVFTFGFVIAAAIYKRLR